MRTLVKPKQVDEKFNDVYSLMCEGQCVDSGCGGGVDTCGLCEGGINVCGGKLVDDPKGDDILF